MPCYLMCTEEKPSWITNTGAFLQHLNEMLTKPGTRLYTTSLSLSLSNGTTARGGPCPPSRVSSILPGLERLLSSFYTLAVLHLPSLHIPNAVWVSIRGAFLLAHWVGFCWINHHHPGIWHVLPISIYTACRISQFHSHHTIDRVLG